MKTFTVTEAPGSKRTSANRDYTHAVIAQEDFDALISFRETENRRSDIDNWNYYSRCANTPVGQKYPENGCSFLIDEQMSKNGKEIIAQYPTAELYTADCRAIAVAEAKAQKEAREGKFAVLQWSQSLQNALKAVNTFRNRWFYKNIKVVAVVEVVKKSKIAA